jgi:hypothetical protein
VHLQRVLRRLHGIRWQLRAPLSLSFVCGGVQAKLEREEYERANAFKVRQTDVCLDVLAGMV